jgi:hypothetical protein
MNKHYIAFPLLALLTPLMTSCIFFAQRPNFTPVVDRVPPVFVSDYSYPESGRPGTEVDFTPLLTDNVNAPTELTITYLYEYAILGFPAPLPLGSGPTILSKFTPPMVAFYLITITATDVAGNEAVKELLFFAEPDPAIEVVLPEVVATNEPTGVVGEPITLTATGTTGYDDGSSLTWLYFVFDSSYNLIPLDENFTFTPSVPDSYQAMYLAYNKEHFVHFDVLEIVVSDPSSVG